MVSMNLCDIAILNIKGADYHCIISGISKLDENCLSLCVFKERGYIEKTVIRHIIDDFKGSSDSDEPN